MIAYNNEWLKNIQAIESVDAAGKERLITPEETQAIRQKLTIGFYTPNTFIRIGLFLLTLVICLFSYGFISLFVMASLEKGLAAIAIFFGLVSYGALEYLIRTKQHFKSGGDDALLWLAASFISGGLYILTDPTPLQNCLLILVIAVGATLRFTDRVMTAVAVLSFFGAIFYLFGSYGAFFRAILPFVCMVVALLLYFGTKRLRHVEATNLYSANLDVVAVLSLVICYVAGNYFVVRELSIGLFQLNLVEGAPLPFGWIFWTVTCMLPLIYLGVGIKQKDRLLIRTGLLLVAVSLVTLKYYLFIASVEVLITLLGLLLLTTAYGLIKFLSTPRFGFVYKETEEEEGAQLESLVIAETFSPVVAPADPARFGGGNFGGAGSSGEF
ncbi:MAG: hypothetical protein V4725_20010 [Bacteroidota bacterium]